MPALNTCPICHSDEHLSAAWCPRATPAQRLAERREREALREARRNAETSALRRAFS